MSQDVATHEVVGAVLSQDGFATGDANHEAPHLLPVQDMPLARELGASLWSPNRLLRLGRHAVSRVIESINTPFDYSETSPTERATRRMAHPLGSWALNFAANVVVGESAARDGYVAGTDEEARLHLNDERYREDILDSVGRARSGLVLEIQHVAVRAKRSLAELSHAKSVLWGYSRAIMHEIFTGLPR